MRNFPSGRIPHLHVQDTLNNTQDGLPSALYVIHPAYCRSNGDIARSLVREGPADREEVMQITPTVQRPEVSERLSYLTFVG